MRYMLVLALGMGLPASALAAAVPVAAIEEVDGLVRVTRAADGTVGEAEEDLELAAGDQVHTLDDGRVTISLEDEHLVKLSENSSLTIKSMRPSGGAKGFWASFKLATGRFFGSFGALTGAGASFEVETATTVAAVKGTTFSVEVEGEIDTTVSVLDGTVAVAAVDEKGGRGDAVRVRAGQETRVKGRARRMARPYGIAGKRMAALRPGLDRLKTAAKRHREMRRSGDLKKLRNLRKLAREGRLRKAGADLRKFMKKNPDLKKRIKKHGKRHQEIKKRREKAKKQRDAVRDRTRKGGRDRVRSPARSPGGQSRGGQTRGGGGGGRRR